MTTPFERRVKRLRKHVLQNKEGCIDDISEDKEPTNTIAFDDITKDKIIEILTEKGIKHNPKDKKEDLYELLEKGE